MSSRSNTIAANRILGALSFWLGVMLFGIGLLSAYYLFGPGAGEYDGLFMVAAGFAIVGGLGAFGYLIAEYICPRVTKEHAWRLYVLSGLLGVVFSTSLCLVKAVTDYVHALPAILGWAVVFAFPTVGGALFLVHRSSSGRSAQEHAVEHRERNRASRQRTTNRLLRRKSLPCDGLTGERLRRLTTREELDLD